MDNLKPHTIILDPSNNSFFRILSGSPQTAGMKSGLVSLQPESSVGLHSTEGREELLLILEGKGEAHIAGSDPLPITSNMAVYIPPYHQHDIINTGPACLKYVYVVSPVNGKHRELSTDK